MYVYIHIYTHVCVRYMHKRVYVYVCKCVYVYMKICIHVRMQNMYVCINTIGLYVVIYV